MNGTATKPTNTLIRFRYEPLLFLLFPIALLAFPIFVGFKDPDYVYCAILNGQGITAALTLYRCFSLTGGAAWAMFWVGLAFSFLVGLYGVVAAFFPKLRDAKILSAVQFVLLFGCMSAMIVAHALLVANVEKVTQQYFEMSERIVDPTSGYTHATIFFFLEMGFPTVMFVWWLVVCLNNWRAIRKAKSTK